MALSDCQWSTEELARVKDLPPFVPCPLEMECRPDSMIVLVPKADIPRVLNDAALLRIGITPARWYEAARAESLGRFVDRLADDAMVRLEARHQDARRFLRLSLAQKMRYFRAELRAEYGFTLPTPNRRTQDDNTDHGAHER